MTPPPFFVRPARDGDLAAIQAIYAQHVLHGCASFEEVPPGLEEMAARRRAVLALGLPYLVAERDGEVVGYAYASLYRVRPAYRHTLEDSVYVATGQEGQGIGRALLARLIAACEAGPWRQMIAAIGDSGNRASRVLHERLGFRTIGILADVGFKHGRWLDSVLMQRALGPGASHLPDAAPRP
ncbi:MAG: GNAT family N-acetyltransferase [Azospirillum brasilense]|nr:MAG: GNAT family N-acetyltransferase [Azospirillum brasilense]